MEEKKVFIAYVDLLGIGDSSVEKSTAYEDQLHRFRYAICDSVDRYLIESDKVYAFSDCAFAKSEDINRLGNYLKWLQKGLWEHGIFLKGAITIGVPEYNDFAVLRGQSNELITKRKNILHGYWFGKEFVEPALLEKNLKGIAIQIDDKITDEKWLTENSVISCYFSNESLKKPIIIRDLKITVPCRNAIDNIIKIFMLISNESRRLSRYYVTLVITWINSYDYSLIEFDIKRKEYSNVPTPFQQLYLNQKILAEILPLVGSEEIYYSLMTKIHDECNDVKVIENYFEFVFKTKKLRLAAEFIPDQLCPISIRHEMMDKRILGLF